MYISEFEESVAPWSAHHHHLSSGGLMMRLSEAPRYLREWSQTYEREYSAFKSTHGPEELANYVWHDQMGMREMHKEFYPKIKVDSLCKIFTRWDETLDEL